MTTKRNFNRLRGAIDARNSQWLEDMEPDIASALRQEIDDGASLDEVERFAVELSGERDRFARKLTSAARHLASVQAGR